MPLSPALVDWLSERGHEAIYASRQGLERAPDEVIIKYAIDSERIIITADLTTLD